MFALFSCIENIFLTLICSKYLEKWWRSWIHLGWSCQTVWRSSWNITWPLAPYNPLEILQVNFKVRGEGFFLINTDKWTLLVTVEPWYKDHLWERAKVVLYQGGQDRETTTVSTLLEYKKALTGELKSGLYSKVVFNQCSAVQGFFIKGSTEVKIILKISSPPPIIYSQSLEV